MSAFDLFLFISLCLILFFTIGRLVYAHFRARRTKKLRAIQERAGVIAGRQYEVLTNQPAEYGRFLLLFCPYGTNQLAVHLDHRQYAEIEQYQPGTLVELRYCPDCQALGRSSRYACDHLRVEILETEPIQRERV